MRTRIGTVIGMSAAFGLLVAGCGSNTPTQSAQPATAAPCPAQEPQKVSNQGADLGSTLVPGSPTSMQLCRYNGTDGSPALGLRGSATIADQAAVRTWQQELNALPAPPKGRVLCPNDKQDAIVTIFAEPDRTVTVRFATSGCALATNGQLTRQAGSALPKLQPLVQGDN